MAALAHHKNADARERRYARPDDAKQLRPVIDRLVEATDPDSIILFGSRARGNHHEDSDYDLMVLVPETRPFGRKPPFWLWHLVKDAGLNIDVLMRQTALFERRRLMVNTIESSIAQEGVSLYMRETPS